jgi:diguanylate cyclase (GGDEF)-like protein/PAS domain S-box-containing protein
MLRSFFQTRQTNPIKVGEEAKQIRINFLLPIVLFTLLFRIAEVVVSLVSKEYMLMVAFSITAIILFVCFVLLRNKNLKAPAILFLFQGYGLLTASLLFDAGYQLSGILFVIFYLMIAGIIFSPKVFILFFIYSAGLLFLMVTDILPPIFLALDLPEWFYSASLVVAIGLIGLVAYLSYLSIEQALQIAVDSNKNRDQVEQEKRKFVFIVDQSPQSIFITDLDGKIKYANPKFTELMGYSADEIIDKTPQILKTEFTPPEFYENLWQTITNGGKWIGEFVNRCKDDTTIYQSAVIVPLTDSNGEKTHYVAFEDDITLHKEMGHEISELNQQLQEKSGELTQMNEELLEQTLRDRLTGLYNRVYLSEILPREILRSVRARNHLILMIIDVDHFRSINSNYGHSIGDLVLQNISKSIMETMGHYDLAFRFGGDEFLLLFSGETNDFGMTRTEQLRKTVANHPMQTDGIEITLTVSIGIAVYPVHGKKEDELLIKAEKALALSRQSGGDRVTLWKEELNEET